MSHQENFEESYKKALLNAIPIKMINRSNRGLFSLNDQLDVINHLLPEVHFYQRKYKCKSS